MTPTATSEESASGEDRGQERQQKRREAPPFSSHNPTMKAAEQSYPGTPDGTFTEFRGLILSIYPAQSPQEPFGKGRQNLEDD